MTDYNDWNRGVIEEFRAKGGKVGGNFEGAPLLLLHHKGRKTGTERVNPMMYQQVGDSMAVFASKGGDPEHPDWFSNLVANPDASVEVGAETIKVHARVAEGEERDQIWSKQKQTFPQFAEYETKTEREIPVVILEPAK